MSLPALEIATRDWLNRMATEHHYMHRPVHQRSTPFGWRVLFDNQPYRPDGRPNGFIVYASIHYTELRDEFGKPGLPTKWQVLSLSRLWLHPDFQTGGVLFSPDILPGFYDRCGTFRSTLATDVIRQTLKLVQRRWIEVHPPRYPDQPYHIRKIISYADTAHHAGTIYRAANFREYGRTVGQPRHAGGSASGSELICFIYDLPEPRWTYEPARLRMEFEAQR